ncbi:MAG TPA: hypothetical protein DEA08_34075 [Planctomycetes bacterium]|nr:hypothetical protein [Planctomycetota bacterium]
MSDLELRQRQRVVPGDPEALLSLLRARARAGEPVPAALYAAAHVGDPLARELLSVDAPLARDRGRQRRRSPHEQHRRWLSELSEHGHAACQQAAVAISRLELELTSLWGWERQPRDLLRQELEHWSECPCIDHVRGVERALDTQRLSLEGASVTAWVARSVHRRREPERSWEQLWRYGPLLERVSYPSLRARVRRFVVRWAYRHLPT